MNILLLYATTEGQTRKIAEHVAGALAERGHEPDLVDAVHGENLDPTVYDAAIIAASLHMHRYQTSIVHYARHWHEALAAMPSAFISVSLAAVSDEPAERAELDNIVAKFRADTGWTPLIVHRAAGALRFSQYDFLKRWIMRRIARAHDETVNVDEDTEYTDWKALTAFVEEFLAAAAARGTV